MLYIVSHSGLAAMIEIHTRAGLSKGWVGVGGLRLGGMAKPL